MSEDTTQLKLLTIGDSGVGKTWLLLRWAGVTGKLSTYSSSMPTIGIDFKMKTAVVKGRRIKIQVWDTAGQERFRTITTSYYRHSQGILLVYDITDAITFESIRAWMAQIRMHADQEVSTILVGNKLDLADQRMVTYEQGASLAKEFNIPFMETSAVDGANVEEAFMSLTESVFNRLEASGVLTGRQNSSVSGSTRSSTNSSGGSPTNSPTISLKSEHGDANGISGDGDSRCGSC